MQYGLSVQPEAFSFEALSGEWGGELDQHESGFGAFEASVAWEQETGRNSPAYVRWVQSGLNRILGATLAVDGVIGPQTRSAIRTFQQRQNLSVDGIVGPQTERALVSAGAGPPPTQDVVLPPDVIQPAAVRLDRFAFDRADLEPFHRQAIDQLAQRIADSWQSATPIRTVRVVGHTDPEGPPTYNLGLGQRRALAVRRELANALDRKQRNLSSRVLILASSKGETELIDRSGTPEAGARNRRVEVFLSTRQLQPIRPPVPPPPPQPPTTPPPQVPPPVVVPPPPTTPTCNRAELARLVDQCVEETRRCAIQATQDLGVALVACQLNPICNAAAAGKYLLDLRRCREALQRCDAAAKRATNCQ
jgi:outer membrane protein OmpA-like peptidoglycan-associated protein